MAAETKLTVVETSVAPAAPLADIHDHVTDAYYGKMGQQFMRETQERIHWICNNIQGRSVLDVGCSQGIVPILLAREGIKVVGVDTSPKAIEEATSHLANEPGHVKEKVTFINADFLSHDFNKIKIETVVISEVLEHLVQPQTFIDAAAKLLPSNGRLIITVPFGINDFIDHKHTFYFLEPYRLITQRFEIIQIQVLGKWLGIVASNKNATKSKSDKTTLSEEQIEQLEAAFYQIERTLRDELSTTSKKLDDANLKYRDACGQITTQKQRIAQEEAVRTAAEGKQQQSDAQLAQTKARLEDERKALQQQITQLVEQGKANTAAAQDIEKKLFRLEIEHQSVRARLDDANQKYREACGQITTLKQRIVQEEAARTAAEGKLQQSDAQLAQTKARLEDERKTLQQQITQLVEQDKANTAAAQDIERKLFRLEIEHQSVRTRLDDANKKYREACEQITTQSQRIVQEEAARTTLEGKLQQSVTQLTQIQGRLDDVNIKYRTATDQVTAIKRDFALQKQQLEVAEAKRSGHYSHLEAERKKCRLLAKQVELLEKDNKRLSNSLSLAVGTAIVNTKSIKDAFLLPSRIYTALQKHKEKLRLKKLGPIQASAHNKPAASISQGNHSNNTSKNVGEPAVVQASSSSVSGGGGIADSKPTAVATNLMVLGWPLPEQNSKIRMMSVFDEFSRECFAPQANLIEPRPDNWLPLLERDKPKFLFVESTWRGNKSTWQYRVAKYANPPGNELSEMVAEFKARKLPTVFWNKEDPVHFDNFIHAAEEFDYIFTTAEEAVPRYAQRSKAKINVLPFAAETGLHNPIGSGCRNNKVCFAGSYYANRFSERRDDQLMLLDAASHFDLDIYDRNAGANVSKDFCFPAHFDRFIRGKLPYEEMSKAYRNYRVFLNVNSVIDSKTMFSRRVFELLACGTPIVSTISAGIEDIFGTDLVWLVKNEGEAKEAIHTLLNSPDEWRRRSLQGIRAIFAQHTFAHRFQDVLRTIGIRDEGISEKRVLLVAEVHTQNELNGVLDTYSRQHLVNAKAWLYVVARAHGMASSAVNMVLVNSSEPLSKLIPQEIKRLEITHIAFIAPTAIYGANYLQDILHAFDYSGASLVGKSISGADEYAYGDALVQSGSVLSAELLGLSDFRVGSLDADNIAAETSRLGKKVFMSDAANFTNRMVMITDEQRSAVLRQIEI